jgi:hypothetical protein
MTSPPEGSRNRSVVLRGDDASSPSFCFGFFHQKTHLTICASNGTENRAFRRSFEAKMTEKSERMLALLQEVAALKDAEESGSVDATTRRNRRKEIRKEMKELAGSKKKDDK